MESVADQFGWINWVVIFGYMALTTWVGHALRGQQSSIKDFFLGGRSLPWPAVSGSIIATEISALTFIGVPGGVAALGGDWTYLQWGIGSIIARVIVGVYLVPIYYEKEIYSPYDFMGNRLGERVKQLVTVLFSMGSILGQSVRVLVTAIILQVVTGLDISVCIVVIGAFALAWTLMGGMRTVIWTDVMQFGLFIVGGLVAFFWLWGEIGWSEVVELNQGVLLEDGTLKDKMQIFNPSTNPTAYYTIWVAIFAMPFQNLAAYGTDQLNAQRIFCCRDWRDARKAIIWSSVSQVITLLMLAVGSGLFAWYVVNEPTDVEARLFAQDPNNVFPVWMVTVLPDGLKGLILAGAFAAAVSSLDSILAALSQTTLSAYYGQRYMEAHGGDQGMVRKSRMLVVVWAILLTLAAVALAAAYGENEDDRDLIGLAFRMLSYTYGPILGILVLALFKKRLPSTFGGVLLGTLITIGLAAIFLPDLYAFLGLVGIDASGFREKLPQFAFVWFYPFGALITVGTAVLMALIRGDNSECRSREI